MRRPFCKLEKRFNLPSPPLLSFPFLAITLSTPVTRACTTIFGFSGFSRFYSCFGCGCTESFVKSIESREPRATLAGDGIRACTRIFGFSGFYSCFGCGCADPLCQKADASKWEGRRYPRAPFFGMCKKGEGAKYPHAHFVMRHIRV